MVAVKEASMSDQAYDHLLSLLDSEMERFWTRFNIFAAVQVGALIGLASEARLFIDNPPMLHFAFFLLIGFSVVGFLSTWRGLDLQRGIVSALQSIEDALPSDSRVVAMIKSGTRLRTHFGTMVGMGFSVFSILLWVVAWIWLVFSGTPIHFEPGSQTPPST
jgi:hypothetical protein